VHIELTELLCCPRCGPPHGLIAFVDRMADRRLLDGRLDCPICEIRHPVRKGIVYLEADGDATTDPSGATRPGPDSAAIAAALLGPPENAEILLLAGGATRLGPELADLRPDAAVVAWGPPPASRHERVFSVVPGPGLRPRLRPGRLDGAVLTGDGEEWLPDVGQALATGARLVVLDPDPALRAPPEARLTELASDARAWVGVRG
jgi:uncharacterized protein YbaR (Trm112 family)